MQWKTSRAAWPDLAPPEIRLTPIFTMNKAPRLTCLIGTYNEAARLPAFLSHALQWADEVVIVDKGSTDETRSIIAAQLYGGPAATKLFFFETKFTPQGHEDKLEQFNFCQTDWVFLMTPGEVPTRELIEKVKAAIAEHGEAVDIITVPKKLYSFGIHHPASPWSIGQQPFVVNRKRAVISNHVHRNFTLRPGGRVLHIPYSETCHVYHPTHATVKGFLRSHFDYIIAEADGATQPDQLIAEAQQQIVGNPFTDQTGQVPPELFGQACAWKLYWLGCMLAAWEKKQTRSAPTSYQEETAQRLAQDWPTEPPGFYNCPPARPA